MHEKNLTEKYNSQYKNETPLTLTITKKPKIQPLITKHVMMITGGHATPTHSVCDETRLHLSATAFVNTQQTL